jgi:uncharacterized protein (DUF1501 family)
MHRRVFLKNGGLAVGLSMVPGFLYRTVTAAAPGDRGKVLVIIFQRGGADGLNTVVPFGDKAYYDHRPGIAIPAPGTGENAALDLDGFFGLHSSLAPLVPLYKSGHLAIVNAVGSPDTGGRSHFQAQDFMESGAPAADTRRGTYPPACDCHWRVVAQGASRAGGCDDDWPGGRRRARRRRDVRIDVQPRGERSPYRHGA